MARRDAARARKMLMIAQVGVEIRSGPLPSPRERGPDLKPQPPHVPRSGPILPAMICGRSVDANPSRLRIFVIVAGRARLHANNAFGPRMSALPPKADICSALTHVRFVPIADIAPSRSITSSAGLSGACEAARQVLLVAVWPVRRCAPRSLWQARCPNGPAGIFPPV